MVSKENPERIRIQVDSNKKQAKINNLITGSASRINNKSEHKERGFTYYYLQGTSPEQKKDWAKSDNLEKNPAR